MADGEYDDSLNTQFRRLQQERELSWPAEQLAANAAQRRALLAAFDAEAVVKPGDRLDPFDLVGSRGEAITLDGIVADGPAILIFFRYAGCPADNLALPYYDRHLTAAAGVPVVAISPQIPERLDAIRERHDLRLVVASDPDNRLANRLGLTFTPIETFMLPPAGWIGEITGTGSWELPQTSVLIVDRDRIVRFVAVSPDWLDRVEAPEILAALREFQTAPERLSAAN
ncbi:peroxiredoxin-like family protein [Sphingomonas sp. MMS24-J13]|uniref:peroxiredoxin-like family protein n=1 Tax=Sphingomonas sp. MMS24-J13 TaxID=3238686 RepID=UPI00384BD151